ncbi:MAG: hypothetical protein WAX89_04530, partial [Alphaproteobacteria bacterium]
LLTWGGLFLQSRNMELITETTRITQQKIPREGKFVELGRYMTEQEKFMQYRNLYPWLVADIGRAIEKATMKFENFEIENPTPQEPSNVMVATIEAKKNAYKGWLQEEPVAKDIMLNSITLAAIRKPPGNTFKLEGLLQLATLNKEFQSTLTQLEQEDVKTLKTAKPKVTATPATATPPAAEGGAQ